MNGTSIPAPRSPVDCPSYLQRARVTVVDDNAVNVDVLSRLLQRSGVADVTGFTDPQQALAHCVSTRPDLVLLDLHMPELDGYRFMQELRATTGDSEFLPVLVLTADVTGDARRTALTVGAKDFITKPFDSVEVMLRVRNLLETGALYTRLREHTVVIQAALDQQLANERAAQQHRDQARNRIETVMDQGRLTMVYQPFVRLNDLEIVGAEALSRFTDEPHRPPNVWFDEAHDVGLLGALECDAVARALSRLAEFPDNTFMSVNASPSTAIDRQLRDLLAKHPADRIVLELTEHNRVADYNELACCLESFRAAGGRVAVDDAGTGYAGLHHILMLHPDVIKLDIALTKGIDADPARRALAASLVRFGAEIGATIIAEGVETGAEYAVLCDLGIDWGQGFYLARPADLPLHLEPGVRHTP